MGKRAALALAEELAAAKARVAELETQRDELHGAIDTLKAKCDAQLPAIEAAVRRDKAHIAELEAVNRQLADSHNAVEQVRFELANKVAELETLLDDTSARLMEA